MYDPNSHGQYNQNAYPSTNMEFTNYSYQNPQPMQAGAPDQQVPYNMFTPTYPPNNAASGEEDYENEPPLLEELGVNFEHIIERTQLVLNPFKESSQEVLDDTDLAGPLVFCLAFGGTLMLAGKLHFNYVYGMGMFGCVFMYLLLSMMSPEGVSVTSVISVLGYCMLPMCALSSAGILLSLKGPIGIGLTMLVILWCSSASSKLFVRQLNMQHQRFLLAYPCALVYSAFALLTIF